MNNQEKWKQIYDEIHAPEDLLGKVMELNMKKIEFKTRNLVKAAVCALAITTGVFAAGNGICYAATGESLVTKVKIIINGKVEEVVVMEVDEEDVDAVKYEKKEEANSSEDMDETE